MSYRRYLGGVFVAPFSDIKSFADRRDWLAS